MKRFIKDYFTFNKRERNGVFILLGIITVQVIWLSVSARFAEDPELAGPVFEEPVRTSSLGEEIRGDRPKLKVCETAIDAGGPAERFLFDPNHLPAEDWRRMGFSDKQIRTIRNYELKGGSFRKKEDLKKMYCISNELYLSLEEFIRIPEHKGTENGRWNRSEIPAVSSTSEQKVKSTVVELNNADSAALTNLKGIGPYFAKSIIRYREGIGGFHCKEQLLEVWKFDAEKFAAIEGSITVDASKIRKVNINTCDAATLKSNYISWNAVKGIVNYRKNHGLYKRVEDIRLTDLVDEETYRKIAPYIVIE